MPIETVETLIVGGGQAGLAMSEHLNLTGGSHLVLEKHRIAERWRTQRWDSLVANGPAWHDRFPSLEFANIGPDDFATRQDVVDYFESYANMIQAPIRCGVEVKSVRRPVKAPGFHVETSEGIIHTTNVVAATGPFQQPAIPPLIPADVDVVQMHSSQYRNPAQLPEGAVLVIGAGSSGSQIAEENLLAGQSVYLSVGPHDRPPRRYRSRDFVWWLGVLGKWDATASVPGHEHVTIAVSGANGGNTVDFRALANRGVTLLGMTESYNNGNMYFADDLSDNIRTGDANYLSVLDEADAYIQHFGIDLPEEPNARHIAADPACMSHPLRTLNLQQAGISSIIWATGFVSDYSWLEVDTFDAQGKPKHERGVSTQPGVYFLGLPWQSRRGSSFIWGVWHDAKYLADHIAKQKHYRQYHEQAAGLSSNKK